MLYSSFVDLSAPAGGDISLWNSLLDSLARKGFTDESLRFVEAMDNPTVVSWMSIIGGCRLNYSQNGGKEKEKEKMKYASENVRLFGNEEYIEVAQLLFSALSETESTNP